MPRVEYFEPGYARVRDSDNVCSYEIGGNCPVQGYGDVRGRELYFRARWVSWSFEIADSNGILPSNDGDSADGFYRKGDHPAAGWMPIEEAAAIVERCLAEFLGNKK